MKPAGSCRNCDGPRLLMRDHLQHRCILAFLKLEQAAVTAKALGATWAALRFWLNSIIMPTPLWWSEPTGGGEPSPIVHAISRRGPPTPHPVAFGVRVLGSTSPMTCARSCDRG
jgi:hypothetical protein